MTAVVESLPEIEGVREIERAEEERFQRDGHIRIDGALDREVIAAYRPSIVDAVYRRCTEASGVNVNLWTIDHSVRRFVLNRRLACIAAALLGVDAVRVFRDEPYFKAAGGVPTPWHQDKVFLPLDTDGVLTIWIPLMDLRPEHAPMRYVTGSHRDGPLGFSPVSEEGMAAFETRMTAKGFTIDTYGSFDTGDVAVHAGWTLHSAGTNRSNERREVLIIIYFADGARVAAIPTAPGMPTLDDLLPGAKPGDLAAGELTPLVYDRRATP